MGLDDVAVDENGYLMATIPAAGGRESEPAIGFIAHVDTSPEMSGTHVKPIVHRAWDGSDIVLPDDPTAVLRALDQPDLAAQIGHDIVTASGRTLLGADDKAGVAAIVEAAAQLIAHPELPHGRVRIAFTPDEEIGRGANRFDVARFGAAYAYTLDGGNAGELEFESFSADLMRVAFVGFNTHPGYAKGRMVNAIRAAARFVDRLPRERLSPETTGGYDGPRSIARRSGSCCAITSRRSCASRSGSCGRWRTRSRTKRERASRSKSRSSIATCAKCSTITPTLSIARARRSAPSG
jgi:tripeptide aminopeptidase